jgi:hypothetical protein
LTTNCYLAIVEEPFEPYDFLSYGREVGSPFAKSILMCGFGESRNSCWATWLEQSCRRSLELLSTKHTVCSLMLHELHANAIPSELVFPWIVLVFTNSILSGFNN